ncbi:hypothetical protein B0H12DRAFT_1105630 [Mycena haematopus]|nr:hypothetical protein B0H12DRAFT_1105630 [Mycena haematopus]
MLVSFEGLRHDEHGTAPQDMCTRTPSSSVYTAISGTLSSIGHPTRLSVLEYRSSKNMCGIGQHHDGPPSRHSARPVDGDFSVQIHRYGPHPPPHIRTLCPPEFYVCNESAMVPIRIILSGMV